VGLKKISHAMLHTYAREDLAVKAVQVEVCLISQLPGFKIVGLPEKSVKESRERVRAAILNSGFFFPNKKVLVNLTPADLPKCGGGFDLPIAIAILLASGQIPKESRLLDYVWVGELGLTGKLVGSDLLGFVVEAYRQERTIILPKTTLPESLQEASCYCVEDLSSVQKMFKDLDQEMLLRPVFTREKIAKKDFDFSMVTGRELEKLACFIAAAGGHHLLFQGPPGVGKTLMAQCFSGILPNLTHEEMLEVALMYSWMGENRLAWQRPMRSPHHHITPAGLMGGGVPIMPGEVSLAHHGVLFLDEITEYSGGMLDQLRESLVSREVHISRVNKKVTLKTKFQLLVAMNPCPCGFFGDEERCHCGHLDIIRHQKNISTPFLDRIDIQVLFHQDERMGEGILTHLVGPLCERFKGIIASSRAKDMVKNIWDKQIQRQGSLNVELSWPACQALVRDARGCKKFSALEKAMDLKGRRWQKVIRVAKTINDCHDIAVSLSVADLNLAHFLVQGTKQLRDFGS
jgi:magnesium chelatase family protein